MKTIEKTMDDAIEGIKNPVPKLSKRETEVLGRIANGDTSSCIAYDLVISTRAVDAHRANIMRKMNVANVAHMISIGYKTGLLT